MAEPDGTRSRGAAPLSRTALALVAVGLGGLLALPRLLSGWEASDLWILAVSAIPPALLLAALFAALAGRRRGEVGPASRAAPVASLLLVLGYAVMLAAVVCHPPCPD